MKAAEFAGSLRERIRIERALPDRDTLGALVGDYAPVGDFWAAAIAVSSGNEDQSEARTSLQNWEFTLRHTDRILPGDRLLWQERVMTVRAVSENFRPVHKSILTAEELRTSI